MNFDIPSGYPPPYKPTLWEIIYSPIVVWIGLPLLVILCLVKYSCISLYNKIIKIIVDLF